MSESKSMKSIRKQLMAAIAMFLVAVIALGSSTYAWFVSNNSVTATTTNISAQSNSAYLVIDTSTTSTTSTTAASAGTTNTPLYPATIDKDDTKAVWSSAYASAANAATIKAGTKFTIGTDGTAAEAVTAKYAVKNTFYIGTGTYDGSFSDLVITGMAISDGETASDLDSAMRVLVVCDTNWQVWSTDGEQLQSGSAAGEALAATVAKNADVQVDIYVYYEGADTNVYSDNLAALTTTGVTLTFEAEPVEFGA